MLPDWVRALRSPLLILGTLAAVGLTLTFGQTALEILDMQGGIRVAGTSINTWLWTAIVVVGCLYAGVLLGEGRLEARRASWLTQGVVILGLSPLLLYALARIQALVADPQSAWQFDLEFMEAKNGFAMLNYYPHDGEPIAGQDNRWTFYIEGVQSTIRVVFVSIVLCTIIGIIVGVLRLSSNKLVSLLAQTYVEIFRNVALVIQIIFWYNVAMLTWLPRITEEASIFDAVYLSNRGIVLPFIPAWAWIGVAVFLIAWMHTRARWFVGSISVEDLGRLKASLRFTVHGVAAVALVTWWVAERYYDGTVQGWMVAILGAVVTAVIVALVVYRKKSAHQLRNRILWTASLGGALLLALRLGLGPSWVTWLVLIALATVGVEFYVRMPWLVAPDDPIQADRLRGRILLHTGLAALALFLFSFIFAEWPAYDRSGNFLQFDRGQGLLVTPLFLAVMMGLVVYTSAQIAEIVRGSIQALPRGQIEAAVAVGLSPFQRITLIILPQALRSMIPATTNQYLNLTKNSALAVVIGYSELFLVSTTIINNVGHAVAVFTLIMLTYQAIGLIISFSMGQLNRRVTRVSI